MMNRRSISLAVLLSFTLLGGFCSTAFAQAVLNADVDQAAEGDWSDIQKTTLKVPKVANNSVTLDASITSKEYGNFTGVNVTPGKNAYILNFPTTDADDGSDGPADTSFTFYLAYDDNFLYVGVDVKDQVVFSGNPNASFWKDDAIEIIVDALNDRYDINTDSSNDLYGGHTYFNYEGRFAEWDDAANARNSNTRWAQAVDWSYGADKEIYGVGKEVTGGWSLEVKFHKMNFESPDAKNKIAAGYKMGFNIGVDDDDKTGPAGDNTSDNDLQIQYWWANRYRAVGWNADVAAGYTAADIAARVYELDLGTIIDATGRLTHGGTGEIIFQAATPISEWSLY